MALTVVASHKAIVTAINTFNAGYHQDYHLVNRLAAQYLAAPTTANAALLARELASVLIRWGAGRRKAPNIQALPALQAALLDPAFHASLLKFAGGALATLTVVNDHARMVDGVAAAARLAEFDTSLLSVLSNISARLLIDNTSVTYPMKVLLLLTGFMPALDSQVRRGLSNTGFVGTRTTQFPMPSGMDSIWAQKLTRLPFYLAECFVANKPLLTDAAATSHYPWLINEPGRLLDILFFMQGYAGTSLFKFVPRPMKWHALP